MCELQQKSENLNKIKLIIVGFNTTGTGEPQSQKKKFDLKESLSKPVTWKMHKGKLPDFNLRKDPKDVPVKARYSSNAGIYYNRSW